MTADGSGRRAGESRWKASFDASGAVEFHLGDEAVHCFRSADIHLQDGELFCYRPAARVDPARRDYAPQRPTQFDSKILGEKRRVRVYLPRGYRQHTDRSYPVLYVKDGQNIFEHGAYGTWAAHTSLDRLVARAEIEEIIVVAVDHGVGRYEDYVPPEDGGRADRYARFLADELKPWIDGRYRTRRGAQDTAVLGSSLGGLAAFYTAWTHSHVFGKVASMSGSWWLKSWRDKLRSQKKRPLRCYLDSGDSGPARDCVHHTLTVSDVLRGMGYQPGADLMHLVGKRHTHTESAWGERVEHPLRFLFPAA